MSLQWPVWQALCAVLAAMVGKQPRTMQKREHGSVQMKVYAQNQAMGLST